MSAALLVLNKIKHGEYIKRFIVILVPLIIMVASWHYNVVCFETNDDYSMMSIVAGFRTGTPMPDTMFCNIIWGTFISTLYRLIGSIPWYAVAYFIIIYLSLVVIYDVCICICNGKIAYGTLMFCTMYICIFCWYTVILQFTVVPAFSGLAAILLMIKESNDPKSGLINSRFILFLILSLFSNLLRKEISYLFIIALITYGVVLYLFFKANVKKYVLSDWAILLITLGINNWRTYTTEWAEFWKYSKARSQWIDYPNLSYYENSDLYQSLGWNEKFYKLASNWFFLDKKFSLDNLTKINEINYENKAIIDDFSIKKILQDLLDGGINGFYISIIASFILLLILLLVKKRKKEIIIFCGGSIATLILLMYIALTGRILFRVVFAIILLFYIPALVISLNKNFVEELVCLGKILQIPVLIIACTLTIYSVTATDGLYKNMENFSKGMEEQQEVCTCLNNFVVQYPNSYFIYDMSLALSGSPFETHPDEKPSNVRFWGGWEAFSPIDDNQLAVNGFKSMYVDDFFNDRVFFISARYSTQISDLLLPYMQEQYADCYLEELFTYDWLKIYQFKK